MCEQIIYMYYIDAKKGTSSRGKRKSSLLKMTKAASLLRNKNMLSVCFFMLYAFNS